MIRTQNPLDYWTNDSRVTIDYQNYKNNEDLYKNFDALILPRRYGGLCLPMNEALMSGLPVIMTDISPNYDILPKKWLIPSTISDKLFTRMIINVYKADAKLLGQKIDEFVNMSDQELNMEKIEAFDLAMKHFDSDTLLPKYKEYMEL